MKEKFDDEKIFHFFFFDQGRDEFDLFFKNRENVTIFFFLVVSLNLRVIIFHPKKNNKKCNKINKKYDCSYS